MTDNYEPQNPIFSDPSVDAEFRTKGYIVLPLLKSDEVEALHHIWKHFVPVESPDFFSTIYIQDIELRRAITDSIWQLTGPHIAKLVPNHRLSSSNFISKPINSARGRIGLHRDWSFTDPANGISVNFWCAMQDTNEANGCMYVVPGSHALAQNQICPATSINSGPWDTVVDILEKRCRVHIPLKAGECLFWDQRLLHGSEANTLSNNRLAMTGTTLPVNAPFVFYMRIPDQPDRLEIVELSDIYSIEFTSPTSIGFRDPARINRLGTMEYITEKSLTPADIEAFIIPEAQSLLSDIQSNEPQAGILAASTPGFQPRKGFLSRLLGR